MNGSSISSMAGTINPTGGAGAGYSMPTPQAGQGQVTPTPTTDNMTCASTVAAGAGAGFAGGAAGGSALGNAYCGGLQHPVAQGACKAASSLGGGALGAYKLGMEAAKSPACKPAMTPKE